ncbi:acetylornithine/N-succinyldiaminopimelate aminotransferase [Oribacterium sp. KHPX15]|nr:aspartate aminotransferase family protein [Oribacterium sp. KHPX15]SEA32413.1 acetylornithine/N-succinyldiaminopimelate aminotransferase [Oribacterium sp. KHPX15]
MKFMDDSIVKGNVVNDRVINDGDKVFYKTYNRFQVAFDHAEGVYLYDVGDNKYLDFGAGISVCGLGYGNDLLNHTMKSQIDKGLLHTSNLFYNEPAVEAAEKLTEMTGMDKVFFTNSGTEAVEGALKIARRYHFNKGKKGCEIIAMQGSFHGRSMGALSVTGKDHYREPFEPLIGGVKFAIYNDLDSVKALINENTGAIIMETFQGEGGIYPATEEFLKGVRKLCDENDLLLILDEIQCGMGRTGYLFAWQEYDVKPDVMTVAKALGNGVPIGAFLACGEAAEAMKPGDHGSTYGGNPFVCAVASAVLDVFKEADIPGHAKKMGEHLWKALEEIKEKYPDLVVDHRGKGLIQGLEFAEGVKVGEIVKKALLEQKLILISAEHNTIRFVPPLVIEREHVNEMQEKLEAVFAGLS